MNGLYPIIIVRFAAKFLQKVQYNFIFKKKNQQKFKIHTLIYYNKNKNFSPKKNNKIHLKNY